MTKFLTGGGDFPHPPVGKTLLFQSSLSTIEFQEGTSKDYPKEKTEKY